MKQAVSAIGAILTITATLAACSPETAQNTQQGSELVVEKGDPKLQQGKALFTENCSSCHHPLKELTGPALQGAPGRWNNDTARIHAFVHNSQKVINGGDAYAKKLYEEFGETVMTPFPQLSGEDIDAILYYVERYKNE